MPRNKITFALAATLFLAANALAQGRKPDPPPPMPAPEPEPAAMLDQIDEFVGAYRRAGSPRLLIHTQVRHGTRDFAALQHFNTRLKALLQHRDVRFANLGSADLQDRTLRNDALSLPPDGAATLLGSRAGAELVFYCRMTAPHGRAEHFDATYVLLDMRTNEPIGQHSWQLEPKPRHHELTVARVDQYARAIGKRVTEELARRYPGTNKNDSNQRADSRLAAHFYSICIKGRPDGRFSREFRDSLRALAGTEADTIRVVEQSADTLEMELRYAGDIFDMQDDLARVFEQTIRRDYEIIEASRGRVVVALGRLGFSYTVTVLGEQGEADLRAFRDALTSLSSVPAESVKMPGLDRQADPPRMTLTLDYMGNRFGLIEDLEERIAFALDREVVLEQLGDNEATVRIFEPEDRFSLRMIGEYDDETLAELERAARRARGVREDSVRFQRVTRITEEPEIAWSLRYDGSNVELQAELRELASATLDRDLEILHAAERQLHFRLLEPRDLFQLSLWGGYSESDLVEFRNQLEGSANVKQGSVQVLWEGIRNGTFVLNLSLRFDGDVFELRNVIRAAARDALGRESYIAEQRGRSLAVQLYAAQPMNELVSCLSGRSLSEDCQPTIDRLQAAYQRQARPVIAVMVNRAPDETDARADEETLDREEIERRFGELVEDIDSLRGLPGNPFVEEPRHDASLRHGPKALPPGPGTGIVVSPTIVIASGGEVALDEEDSRPVEHKQEAEERGETDNESANDGDEPGPEAVPVVPTVRELDTFAMENEVIDRMINLGLQLKDLSHEKQQLRERIDMHRIVLRDNEAAFLLGRIAKADIVVSGRGLIERDDSGRSVRLQYTFRAYNVADSRILAAANVEESREVNVADSRSDLAGQAVGTIMSQLLKSWNPPLSLDVTVTNAATKRDVYAIMRVLRERIGSERDDDEDPVILSTTFRSHQMGAEGGVGKFIIEYNSDYDALNEALFAEENLPFTLDAPASDRQTLTLRINREIR